MRCPFGFGSAAQDVASAGREQAAAAGGRCPFGFTSTKGGALSDGGAAPEAESKSQGGIQPTAGLVNLPSSAPPAACPYGFSSAASAGPKLSALHCVLCKSFLYDPVVASPCKHLFCRVCLAPFSDCPVCGHDIQSRTPDTVTQGLVDQLLAAHVAIIRGQRAAQDGSDGSAAGSPASCTDVESVVSAASPASGLGHAQGTTPSPAASFFLHLGLQALRGGNPAAALSRLEQCKQELLHVCEEEALALGGGQADPQGQQAAEPVPLPAMCGDLGARIVTQPPGVVPHHLAGPLGAVFGSQGDACRALGALHGAVALYAASAACLAAAAEAGDDEACHALSVSMNKLGDTQYIEQDLAAAQRSYSHALDLRQRRLQRVLAATSGSPCSQRPATLTQLAGQLSTGCLQQALDVAASCIKVADAAGAAGDGSSATTAAANAHTLVTRCAALLADGEFATSRPELSARCRQLQAVLGQLMEDSASRA